MVALLYLLSRNQPVEIVMLVAMGVVGAIRTCSYYKEALATDIAKILPFALLGIMLIDNSIIRILDSTDGVREAALQWETVVYYLVAVVTLEFVLRMATGIFNFFRNRRKARKAQKQTAKQESVRQAHESTKPVAPQPEVNGLVSEPRPVGQSLAHVCTVLRHTQEWRACRESGPVFRGRRIGRSSEAERGVARPGRGS